MHTGNKNKKRQNGSECVFCLLAHSFTVIALKKGKGEVLVRAKANKIEGKKVKGKRTVPPSRHA